LSHDGQEQVLVFDVGGSHIASSLFDPARMSIGPLSHLPVASGSTFAEFLATFDALAKRTLPNGVVLAGLAVAMPNPFDYERGVSYMRHKYQQIYGENLRTGLSCRLKVDPDRIHFLNDAAAFLTGELHKGAATGVGRAIGITLGTGVGSAFAVNGKIVLNGRGVPPGGEIWNLPYRDSIVEDVISTRAIQRLYEQRAGCHAEVREIAAMAEDNMYARQTFESFGNELGKVLRHIGLEFGPDRVVLGGGISRAAALFLPATEEELADIAIPLRVSTLFDQAPLIGAGISWMQKHMPEKIPENRIGP
jgi:glucokinase